MGWGLVTLQKEGQRCDKVEEHQEVVEKGEEEGADARAALERACSLAKLSDRV